MNLFDFLENIKEISKKYPNNREEDIKYIRKNY